MELPPHRQCRQNPSYPSNQWPPGYETPGLITPLELPQPNTMILQPPPAPQDDGLDWLRDIRRKITSEFDHNPHRLGDKLREMEKLPQYAGRIVRVKKVLVPVTEK